MQSLAPEERRRREIAFEEGGSIGTLDADIVNDNTTEDNTEDGAGGLKDKNWNKKFKIQIHNGTLTMYNKTENATQLKTIRKGVLTIWRKRKPGNETVAEAVQEEARKDKEEHTKSERRHEEAGDTARSKKRREPKRAKQERKKRQRKAERKRRKDVQMMEEQRERDVDNFLKEVDKKNILKEEKEKLENEREEIEREREREMNRYLKEVEEEEKQAEEDKREKIKSEKRKRRKARKQKLRQKQFEKEREILEQEREREVKKLKEMDKAETQAELDWTAKKVLSPSKREDQESERKHRKAKKHRKTKPTKKSRSKRKRERRRQMEKEIEEMEQEREKEVDEIKEMDKEETQAEFDRTPQKLLRPSKTKKRKTETKHQKSKKNRRPVKKKPRPRPKKKSRRKEEKERERTEQEWKKEVDEIKEIDKEDKQAEFDRTPQKLLGSLNKRKHKQERKQPKPKKRKARRKKKPRRKKAQAKSKWKKRAKKPVRRGEPFRHPKRKFRRVKGRRERGKYVNGGHVKHLHLYTFVFPHGLSPGRKRSEHVASYLIHHNLTGQTGAKPKQLWVKRQEQEKKDEAGRENLHPGMEGTLNITVQTKHSCQREKKCEKKAKTKSRKIFEDRGSDTDGLREEEVAKAKFPPPKRPEKENPTINSRRKAKKEKFEDEAVSEKDSQDVRKDQRRVRQKQQLKSKKQSHKDKDVHKETGRELDSKPKRMSKKKKLGKQDEEDKHHNKDKHHEKDKKQKTGINKKAKLKKKNIPEKEWSEKKDGDKVKDSGRKTEKKVTEDNKNQEKYFQGSKEEKQKARNKPQETHEQAKERAMDPKRKSDKSKQYDSKEVKKNKKPMEKTKTRPETKRKPLRNEPRMKGKKSKEKTHFSKEKKLKAEKHEDTSNRNQTEEKVSKDNENKEKYSRHKKGHNWKVTNKTEKPQELSMEREKGTKRETPKRKQWVQKAGINRVPKKKAETRDEGKKSRKHSESESNGQRTAQHENAGEIRSGKHREDKGSKRKESNRETVDLQEEKNQRKISKEKGTRKTVSTRQRTRGKSSDDQTEMNLRKKGKTELVLELAQLDAKEKGGVKERKVDKDWQDNKTRRTNAKEKRLSNGKKDWDKEWGRGQAEDQEWSRRRKWNSTKDSNGEGKSWKKSTGNSAWKKQSTHTTRYDWKGHKRGKQWNTNSSKQFSLKRGRKRQTGQGWGKRWSERKGADKVDLKYYGSKTQQGKYESNQENIPEDIKQTGQSLKKGENEKTAKSWGKHWNKGKEARKVDSKFYDRQTQVKREHTNNQEFIPEDIRRTDQSTRRGESTKRGDSWGQYWRKGKQEYKNDTKSYGSKTKRGKHGYEHNHRYIPEDIRQSNWRDKKVESSQYNIPVDIRQADWRGRNYKKSQGNVSRSIRYGDWRDRKDTRQTNWRGRQDKIRQNNIPKDIRQGDWKGTKDEKSKEFIPEDIRQVGRKKHSNRKWADGTGKVWTSQTNRTWTDNTGWDKEESSVRTTQREWKGTGKQWNNTGGKDSWRSDKDWDKFDRDFAKDFNKDWDKDWDQDCCNDKNPDNACCSEKSRDREKKERKAKKNAKSEMKLFFNVKERRNGNLPKAQQKKTKSDNKTGSTQRTDTPNKTLDESTALEHLMKATETLKKATEKQQIAIAKEKYARDKLKKATKKLINAKTMEKEVKGELGPPLKGEVKKLPSEMQVKHTEQQTRSRKEMKQHARAQEQESKKELENAIGKLLKAKVTEKKARERLSETQLDLKTGKKKKLRKGRDSRLSKRPTFIPNNIRMKRTETGHIPVCPNCNLTIPSNRHLKGVQKKASAKTTQTGTNTRKITKEPVKKYHKETIDKTPINSKNTSKKTKMVKTEVKMKEKPKTNAATKKTEVKKTTKPKTDTESKETGGSATAHLLHRLDHEDEMEKTKHTPERKKKKENKIENIKVKSKTNKIKKLENEQSKTGKIKSKKRKTEETKNKQSLTGKKNAAMKERQVKKTSKPRTHTGRKETGGSATAHLLHRLDREDEVKKNMFKPAQKEVKTEKKARERVSVTQLDLKTGKKKVRKGRDSSRISKRPTFIPNNIRMKRPETGHIPLCPNCNLTIPSNRHLKDVQKKASAKITQTGINTRKITKEPVKKYHKETIDKTPVNSKNTSKKTKMVKTEIKLKEKPKANPVTKKTEVKKTSKPRTDSGRKETGGSATAHLLHRLDREDEVKKNRFKPAQKEVKNSKSKKTEVKPSKTARQDSKTAKQKAATKKTEVKKNSKPKTDSEAKKTGGSATSKLVHQIDHEDETTKSEQKPAKKEVKKSETKKVEGKPSKVKKKLGRTGQNFSEKPMAKQKMKEALARKVQKKTEPKKKATTSEKSGKQAETTETGDTATSNLLSHLDHESKKTKDSLTKKEKTKNKPKKTEVKSKTEAERRKLENEHSKKRKMKTSTRRTKTKEETKLKAQTKKEENNPTKKAEKTSGTKKKKANVTKKSIAEVTNKKPKNDRIKNADKKKKPKTTDEKERRPEKEPETKKTGDTVTSNLLSHLDDKDESKKTDTPAKKEEKSTMNEMRSPKKSEAKANMKKLEKEQRNKGKKKTETKKMETKKSTKHQKKTTSEAQTKHKEKRPTKKAVKTTEQKKKKAKPHKKSKPEGGKKKPEDDKLKEAEEKDTRPKKEPETKKTGDTATSNLLSHLDDKDETKKTDTPAKKEEKTKMKTKMSDSKKSKAGVETRKLEDEKEETEKEPTRTKKKTKPFKTTKPVKEQINKEKKNDNTQNVRTKTNSNVQKTKPEAKPKKPGDNPSKKAEKTAETKTKKAKLSKESDPKVQKTKPEDHRSKEAERKMKTKTAQRNPEKETETERTEDTASSNLLSHLDDKDEAKKTEDTHEKEQERKSKTNKKSEAESKEETKKPGDKYSKKRNMKSETKDTESKHSHKAKEMEAETKESTDDPNTKAKKKAATKKFGAKPSTKSKAEPERKKPEDHPNKKSSEAKPAKESEAQSERKKPEDHSSKKLSEASHSQEPKAEPRRKKPEDHPNKEPSEARPAKESKAGPERKKPEDHPSKKAENKPQSKETDEKEGKPEKKETKKTEDTSTSNKPGHHDHKDETEKTEHRPTKKGEENRETNKAEHLKHSTKSEADAKTKKPEDGQVKKEKMKTETKDKEVKPSHNAKVEAKTKQPEDDQSKEARKEAATRKTEADTTLKPKTEDKKEKGGTGTSNLLSQLDHEDEAKQKEHKPTRKEEKKSEAKKTEAKPSTKPGTEVEYGRKKMGKGKAQKKKADAKPPMRAEDKSKKQENVSKTRPEQKASARKTGAKAAKKSKVETGKEKTQPTKHRPKPHQTSTSGASHWTKQSGSNGTLWGNPPEIPYTGIDGAQLLGLKGPGKKQRQGEGNQEPVERTHPPKHQWFFLIKQHTCTLAFKNLQKSQKGAQKGKIHIMCDPRYDPKKIKIVERGVSPSDVKLILRLHNKHRANPGHLLPDNQTRHGSQMARLYWDPYLAKVAQRKTDGCNKVMEDDKMDFREIPGYNMHMRSVKQNVCSGPTVTWTSCIEKIFEQSKTFQWGQNNLTKSNNTKIKQYVNMIADTALRVGCGYTWCNKRDKKFVCNYVWNTDSTKKKKASTPFIVGKPCSACPHHCKDGLCDCKGKMCYNGILMLSTCTCQCGVQFSGDSCEIQTCSEKTVQEGKCSPAVEVQDVGVLSEEGDVIQYPAGKVHHPPVAKVDNPHEPKMSSQATTAEIVHWTKQIGPTGTIWGEPLKTPYTGIDGTQLLGLQGPGKKQRQGKGKKEPEERTYPPKEKWFFLTKQNTCTPAFKGLQESQKGSQKHKSHIMCDPRYDPKKIKIVERGVSPSDVKLILRLHNKHRANPGHLLPDNQTRHGSQMARLYWDPYLAKVAQRKTDGCNKVMEDDKMDFREIPGYNMHMRSVKQNVCSGPTVTWTSCIEKIFEQSKTFLWGQRLIGSKDAKIKQYINMIVDSALRVGCGYTWCNKKDKKFVCNYIWDTDAVQKRKVRAPFAVGKPCSGCPHHCKDGLCDCKGKMCHYGILILSSCTCRCWKQFAGDNCEIQTCSEKAVQEGKCGLAKEVQDVGVISEEGDVIQYPAGKVLSFPTPATHTAKKTKPRTGRRSDLSQVMSRFRKNILSRIRKLKRRHFRTTARKTREAKKRKHAKKNGQQREKHGSQNVAPLWTKRKGPTGTRWGEPPGRPYTGIDGTQLLGLKGPGQRQRQGEGTQQPEERTYPPRHKWFFLAKQRTCTLAYRKLQQSQTRAHRGKTHIMCDPRYDPKNIKIVERGVSPNDVKLILRLHNEHRANPANLVPGSKKRYGSHMTRLYWDPNLAKVAQRKTDGCNKVILDDKMDIRNIPGYLGYIRQNVCSGPTITWTSCIEKIFEQSRKFNWGQRLNGNKEAQIRQYMNMVVDVVTRVGCGYTWCNTKSKKFVCNYAWNMGGGSKMKQPFVVGKPCAACPRHCTDGLCDCKGKICYNGILDLKTCKCRCRMLFSGDSCEIMKCSNRTKWKCSKALKVQSVGVISQEGKVVKYPAGQIRVLRKQLHRKSRTRRRRRRPRLT